MSVHREMRSDDARDEANWTLECEVQLCSMRFDRNTSVGVLAEHWNLEHAGQQVVPDYTAAMAVPDQPRLRLVWIGVGQNPEAGA